MPTPYSRLAWCGHRTLNDGCGWQCCIWVRSCTLSLHASFTFISASYGPDLLALQMAFARSPSPSTCVRDKQRARKYCCDVNHFPPAMVETLAFETFAFVYCRVELRTQDAERGLNSEEAEKLVWAAQTIFATGCESPAQPTSPHRQNHLLRETSFSTYTS